MNRFENITKPLMWFMALLLAAFVAGCGGSSSSSGPAPSSAKAINTFSLAWTTAGTSANATGIIDQTQKTIKVTVPYGTVLTPMYATFTTTGASVTVDPGTGPVTQKTGVTANDFSNPVSYKVTGADGTWATYTVLITVSANTAKAITSFTLANGVGGAATINSIGTVISGLASPFNIVVTMPFLTTDLTALVATFTTAGSSVKISDVTQNSGAAPTNNFTNSVTTPVVYTVTAANGTTATYKVTVTVALNSAKTITAFTLAASGVPSTATAITGTGTTLDPFDILVTMPNGTTDLTALVATFTAPAASSVKVGTTLQQSGISKNDFSAALAASGVSAVPVKYDVTAADSSTATYNVTVTVAAVTGPVVCTGNPNCVNLATAADFVILAYTGIGNTPTSVVTGDMGISPSLAAAITGFSTPAVDATNDFSTSSEVTGKIYAPDYTGGQGGSTGLTPAKMTAAQNDMLTAYNLAKGKTAGVGSNLNRGAGTVTTQTLAPGNYTWTTGVTIPTATVLTLNGTATDVWVFQISGALVQSAATQVKLTGGALPQNVFWQVSGGVTIGTTAHMEGVILSATAITLQTGAVEIGRLLAQTAVTLDGNTVTQP
jgi:Ice-binding-like